MFTFLTENPTSVFLLLAAGGIAHVAAILMTGRVRYAVGLALVILLAIAVWVVDYLVVTNVEQVELNTYGIAQAAEHGDIERLSTFFASQISVNDRAHTRDELMRKARQYMPPTPSRPRRIRFWNVAAQRTDDPNRIACTCSAKASGIEHGHAVDDHPVALEFDFSRESDGQWRVRRLRILDPVTGKNEVIQIP